MATWTGWQSQLLGAAGLPTGSNNHTFLTEWSTNANRYACANNPVDISHSVAGSSNCGQLPSSKIAQRFGSHGAAARAFTAQINSGDYTHLHAALKADDPYAASRANGVALDLERWGSTKWQAVYVQRTGAGGGVGGGGGGGSNGIAPNTLRGLHAVKRSFARFGTQTLQARSNTQAALSMLPRRRRVHR